MFTFKNILKMITIDLSKQQALDAYPRAMQQINFTANLERAGNRGKRNYFGLLTRNCKSFVKV